MSAAAGIALGLALAASMGMIVGFSVQSTQINPARPLVQQGNFTWDIYTGSVVADSLVVNYQLYQGPSYYLLQLAPLPRPLAIPEGMATSQSSVQVRMHLFHPEVAALNAFGWWELIIPLSQPNLNAIVLDGPCFLSVPPTCDIAGWPGDGHLGENSLGFSSEYVSSTYEGYAQLFMQTLSVTNVDWTNYTFGTTQALQLTLMSA